MIILYEKNTGEIKVLYQGDIPQLHNYGNEAKDWGEVHFPDDPNVNIQDYKIIVYNGKPICYSKKPKLCLKFNKKYIAGDGEDEAILSVEVTDIHPLELDKHNTVNIRVNDEIIEAANGDEIIVVSEEDDYKIKATGDSNKYRVESAVLEVV